MQLTIWSLPFQPRPIIDTISEHEKYGNEGDRFYGIGRAIVNGYEQFANFMNKLLNVYILCILV